MGLGGVIGLADFCSRIPRRGAEVQSGRNDRTGLAKVVLLPQRDGCDLCGAVPADVLHINTADAFGTPRPPNWFDYFTNYSRPNLYAFEGESASLPACAGAPAEPNPPGHALHWPSSYTGDRVSPTDPEDETW